MRAIDSRGVFVPHYKAPVRDLDFVLNRVLEAPRIFARVPSGGTRCMIHEISADAVTTLLGAAGRFVERELVPLNAVGDRVGVSFREGTVTTPPGYRQAFAALRASGFQTMGSAPAYGGQGLPDTLELAFNELANAACHAFRLCSGLTVGAIRAIAAHGTDELKALYLPKLVSAEWTGTMCLTEPEAGSDVGLLSARARPLANGRYAITGTKIFITFGDHDLADNIVHLVLARLPDAPPGVKGISLFAVPKRRVNADGSAGAPNGVSCGAIEHKMGLHGSPTCTLHFEDAVGDLIGAAHGGLACMFTTMNYVRLDVAQQGLALADRAFQGALAYARERLQMRAPGGAVAPAQRADPILAQPDVRRMLMVMKSLVEGGRALALFAALQHDRKRIPEERAEAEATLALLVPICKAFLTEVGIEATGLGVQCWGGHGYIRDSGMEQLSRDVRVTAIYEGTNGIQANDLLRRKVFADGGRALEHFLAEIAAQAGLVAGTPALAYQAPLLAQHADEWRVLARELAARDKHHKGDVSAAAFDHLMYGGYVCLAYFWSRMAHVAERELASASASDAAYFKAKLQTARFYFERVLPRTRGHVLGMRAHAGSVLDDDAFAELAG
jgi:alkylation response protein AidB-like acyl-CoA dehydrogenase